MKRYYAWTGAAFLAIANSMFANAEVALSPVGDGLDTVPVLVNGHGPYPFILDTAADSTAVYEWFAEQSDLPEAASRKEPSSQTASITAPIFQIDDLELEGRHLRHTAAYGMPNRPDARRVAGVLGNDIMDGALVVFDFPCHRMAFHNTDESGELAGASASPVLAKIYPGSSLLTLPLTVNSYTGIAVLDTGSRNTRLTPSFARAAGVAVTSSQFHDGAAIYGANSKKRVPRNGPIGTVSFGGIQMADVEAQVIDLPALEEEFKGEPAMVLGVDLLGRNRLLYDHRANKIWIRPSKCRLPG